MECIEQQRCELQSRLDAAKTARERNKLGQFATPADLARDVVSYGLSLLPPNVPIRFLDPAVGTGAFYSALLATVNERRIEKAIGVEIDPHYGEPAKRIWAGSSLDYRMADFTKSVATTNDSANLLICNPPYVRHHHIDVDHKKRLQVASEHAAGIRVKGLAGLYCYFLTLAHPWMQPGAIAGWLIPSEFMDVNYGVAVKQYLLSKVTLLRIHRFDPDDVQFDDALVSSAVVWIRNAPPPLDHSVNFTFGGSLLKPDLSRDILASTLDADTKWSCYPKSAPVRNVIGPKVGDLFKIRRGIATGDNGFFVLTPEQAEEHRLPSQFLRPILPSSRHIPVDEIEADENGMPRLERRLLLLDCKLSAHTVEQQYPTLWKYLERGHLGAAPVAGRYLCKTRSPWYSQEVRQPAPLICTYMSRSDGKRKRPFRFLLNHSQAIAGNVYLMLYPQPFLEKLSEGDPDIIRRIWAYLNELPAETLVGEGRVYGGGLYKLEPRELANVQLSVLSNLIPELSLAFQGTLCDDIAA